MEEAKHSREDSGQVETADRYGSPIDRQRAVRVLLRAKWWLLGAVLLGLAIALPVAKFVMPNIYPADTMVKFESMPAIDEDETARRRPALGALVQAIFVDDVISEVRRRVGLEGSLTDIRNQIVASADVQNETIKISTAADDPQKAAKFANTVAEVFLEHQVSSQRRWLEGELQRTEERLRAAKVDLDQARKAYDEFRREHGITDLTTEQEAQLTSATDLAAQRDMTRSEIAALEAQIAQLKRELANTPRMVVASAASHSPERDELARLQGELASAQATLSNDHPRVQALQHKVRTLRLRVNSGEASNVSTATMGTSGQFTAVQGALTDAQVKLEAAKERLTGLEELASEARARVTEFSSIEGDASQLLSTVKVKEQVVADLRAREARIEDLRRQPSSGFRQLDPATPPDRPVRNKNKWILAGGLPSALLLLVLGFLLWRELRGLKVYTAAELAYWGRGPVIGSTTWPRDPRAIDELIADMDDFAPEARGRMLVVGARPEETSLAYEIATRLADDWFATTLIGAPGYASPTDPGPAPYGGGPAPYGGPASYGEHAPYATPPPSGIDPMSAAPTTGTSLARTAAHSMVPFEEGAMEMSVEAWDGPVDGQGLRRAVRLADRVAVVVTSGSLSAFELSQIRTRIGRKGLGVGYILVGVPDVYSSLIDRAGPVEAFWKQARET